MALLRRPAGARFTPGRIQDIESYKDYLNCRALAGKKPSRVTAEQGVKCLQG